MEELTKYEKEFYTQRIKYLKHQIKQVQNDCYIDEEYKKTKLALLNEQVELLKKDFIRRLTPKEKYNRTLKKREDKKIIDEVEK